MMKNTLHVLGLLLTVASVEAGPAPVTDKLKGYMLESPYQNEPSEIRVLVPDNYDPKKKYPVVYILPVGAAKGAGQGSALIIFTKANLQNRYEVILAEPTYEITPWFGDHPTDQKIRQESYLRDFVVPFVEKNYSTLGTPEGRMLLGFSKSGWGAFALIFRNPDFFGYAASWDAPYFFVDFRYGMAPVFDNTEYLKKYRPDLLVVEQKAHFQNKTRLVMGGEDKWGKAIPTPSGGSHTVEMHELMEKEGVKHVYRPDLKTLHTWSAAWIVPTFEELMKIAGINPVLPPPEAQPAPPAQPVPAAQPTP